jgi:signal transduction histidine kinase
MKLTPKLTIIFIVLAVAPIIAISLLAYNYSRQALEQQVINHLISTNLLKSSELHRWIEDNQRSLEEFAQRPLVRQNTAVLNSHDTSSPDYIQAKTSLLEDHFKPRLTLGGGFIELFIMRPLDGIILVSSNSREEGRSGENETYFIKGKEHTFFQSAFYSSSLEQTILLISTPVKDIQGSLVGVLAGSMDLAELSVIMVQQSGLSRTEDSYLVNSSNYFITEPRFGQDYALKKSVYTEGVIAGLAGQDGWKLYNDYRDVPVIGAYKWLSEYDMCLLTEIDEEEAFSPIYSMARVIVPVACSLVLLVVLAAFLFARTLTHPLQKLVTGAQMIGGGDLDYKVGTEARDEVGELSRAFDRMTSELKTTLVSRNELAREITERKKAEEELKRSNAELERFAYVASHDLQEPLRMVSSYVQLLEKRYKDKLDADAHDFINFTVDGALRMKNLINDLLDYSRVDSRAKPFQPVNLEDAFNIAVNNLSVAIAESGAEITHDPLPTVMADEGQIIRVFQNLLSNAVKFRSDQSPHIHVSARQAAEEWIFSVADNGIGIESQYFERIFQIFQRLHGREYPGTGAGLSIAKRIIERHEGRIWVESQPGTGSTFYFTLPLKEKNNHE